MSIDKVEFTQKQMDFLEKQFPEQVGTPQTTDAQLRYWSGQRSVIAVLRTRVQTER